MRDVSYNPHIAYGIIVLAISNLNKKVKNKNTQTINFICYELSGKFALVCLMYTANIF